MNNYADNSKKRPPLLDKIEADLEKDLRYTSATELLGNAFERNDARNLNSQGQMTDTKFVNFSNLTDMVTISGTFTLSELRQIIRQFEGM